LGRRSAPIADDLCAKLESEESATVAYLIDNGHRGLATALSGPQTPNAANPLPNMQSMVLDSDANLAPVTDFDLSAVAAVDLATGERVLYSR
jgi:hypothetical protein